MKIKVWAAALGGLGAGLVAFSAEAYTLRFKGEAWLYGFAEANAYFAAGDNYAWAEAMARAQVTLELGNHLVLEARGVGTTTLGADYYTFLATDAGVSDWKPYRWEPRIDTLSVNLERILGGRTTVKIGRQEIILGDGFLVGDGFDEYGELNATVAQAAAGGDDIGYLGAGQYIIPFKYWDGVRATVALESLTVDLMASRLSPSVLPLPLLGGPAVPGLVIAADVAWAGESANAGLTLVRKEILPGLEDEENAPGNLNTVALRGGGSAGDTEVAASAVVQAGTFDALGHRAFAGYLKATHTLSNNPYTPKFKIAASFFSGDNPATTDVTEGYDPLFYDWSDFGEWYLGNMASSQWFTNTDEVVAQAEIAFMPTPVQNARLMVYYFSSQTGRDIYSNVLAVDDCADCTVGSFAPLALEVNLLWDWCPIEVGNWKPDSALYFGALAGLTVPLGAMVEYAGDAMSAELMLFSTVNF